MRWGSDDIGVVLTRNEIWLLLHALAEAPAPAVDWEGNRVEPWVVGELRARLQTALRPDPVSDVEERPIIRLDSDMGRSLGLAGVRPLTIDDGYDLGSLVAACAERGWGMELRLPVGSGPETPAEAVITTGNGQRANGDGDVGRFVGLERPVVALARALIGAFEGAGAIADRDHQPLDAGPRSVDEYIVPTDAINPGERDALVTQMAEQGWELVGEDGRGVVFRRQR